MLDLSILVKAPIYDFEVTLHRKRSLNAVQNARKRIAYVKAHNPDEAKKAAARTNPEFIAVSARRAA